MQDLVTPSTERISVSTVRALAQYALWCIAVALSTSHAHSRSRFVTRSIPFQYTLAAISHFAFYISFPISNLYCLSPWVYFLAQFPRGSNKVLEGCFPLRVLVLVFVDRSRCILQIGPPTNHGQTPSNSTPSFSHPIT